MKSFFKVLTSCLWLTLAFAIPFKGQKTILADKIQPYDLGSVVTIGDSTGGKNIIHSIFDAVNLTVINTSADDNNYQQYVYYEFTTEKVDFSSADSLILQIGNSFWGSCAVNVMIGDNAGHLKRVIGDDWSSSEVNQTNQKYATLFYSELGGEVTNTTYPGYGFENIPALYSGYMEIKINDFVYEWGATEFDSTNVVKIIVGLDAKYNPFTKINIGNMFINKGDDCFEKVYDVTKAMEGFGTADNYGKWQAENGKSADHVKANLIGANQIRTFANFTQNNNQWSDFYMLMPTDISLYNGISYYVDNSAGDKDVFFNKFIKEGADGVIGEQWYCDGGYATFISEQGDNFTGEVNIVPAGFVGRVIVPFTDFAIPSWGSSVDNILNLNNVWWNFGFTFDVSRGEDTFIFKDVKLVADAYEYKRIPQNAVIYGDTKIVLPFDYYDNFDLGSDWKTCWDKASPCTIQCVDSPASNVTGVAGKAMKFTCGKMKTVEGASNETALEHYPSETQSDIKGAKGITYYIKNISDSQIGFNFGFDLLVEENIQQRWTTKMNARYTLYDVKTGVQLILNGKNGIYVPAGFEGFVRINFSQFVNPVWETNGSDFSDEFKVAYMVINMNSLLHEDESFILDSIGYYYSDTQISTTFYSSTNTIFNAMNKIS